MEVHARAVVDETKNIQPLGLKYSHNSRDKAKHYHASLASTSSIRIKTGRHKTMNPVGLWMPPVGTREKLLLENKTPVDECDGAFQIKGPNSPQL